MEAVVLKQKHVVIDEMPFIDLHVRINDDYIELQEHRDVICIHKSLFAELVKILDERR